MAVNPSNLPTQVHEEPKFVDIFGTVGKQSIPKDEQMLVPGSRESRRKVASSWTFSNHRLSGRLPPSRCHPVFRKFTLSSPAGEPSRGQKTPNGCVLYVYNVLKIHHDLGVIGERLQEQHHALPVVHLPFKHRLQTVEDAPTDPDHLAGGK